MVGLTERDFAHEVDGSTITQLLAAVAPSERDAVRRVRTALRLDPRPLPPSREGGRVLPPQVVHDLAGARYETLLLLDALATSGDDALQTDVGGGVLAADVLRQVAAHDIETARRIEARAPRSEARPRSSTL